MRAEQLRSALTEHAAQVEPTPPRERLAGIHERAAVLGRRRGTLRAVLGSLAAVALVTAVVLVPAPGSGGGGPDLPEPSPDNEQPVIDPPPPLVDYTLPLTITRQGVAYEYARSEESPQGRGLLRVAVAPQDRPATVVWATSRGAGGSMVISVDGDRLQTDPGGRLRSGLMLTKGRAHLVTIRHTAPSENSRIGFALYTWPDEPD